MGRRRRTKQDAPRDPLDRFVSASAGRNVYIAAHAAIVACLVVACLVNFRGVSDNLFVNDDFVWLNDARNTMTPGNLATHRVIGFFRPLVNLSFWAQERLFPGDVALYNRFNLLLHVLNTLLVFQLVRLLLRKPTVALAAACLFAVTDSHIGAVLWISARTTLLASFFLLASLVALLSWPGRRRLALGLSVALYVLALAAKETAVVGFPLVVLIAVLARGRPERPLVRREAVVSFGVVTALYFALRLLALGGLGNSEWGIGFHAIRNLGGGVLSLLYPRPLVKLLSPDATRIPQLANPFLPEILALPLLGLLLWVGIRLKKARPMILALGWLLVALLPTAFFRYRFLHYQTIQQSRYYYLAAVGLVLVWAILLSRLWESRKPGRMIAGAAIVLLVCVSCVRYNRVTEAKWAMNGQAFRPYVATMLEGARAHPDLPTLVVENAQVPVRFLEAAVRYEMPQLDVHEVSGGRDRAAAFSPCVYVWYTVQRGRVRVHYEAIR
ncbi:MAG: hypothetical protein JW819_13330 [Candidatus Krumholzibacteriota bacterium]|nr:hypothetical protein [Candidatus Krumholzibacteriota bacterium]